MSLFSMLLAVPAAIGFLAALLYVLFGQITVRKLRKNPATKTELGVEFVSGWDIVNVAQSLSLPRGIAKRLKNTPVSFLYANSELLRKHTTRFDRILGAAFYWSLMTSGLGMIALVALDSLGVFES